MYTLTIYSARKTEFCVTAFANSGLLPHGSESSWAVFIVGRVGGVLEKEIVRVCS